MLLFFEGREAGTGERGMRERRKEEKSSTTRADSQSISSADLLLLPSRMPTDVGLVGHGGTIGSFFAVVGHKVSFFRALSFELGRRSSKSDASPSFPLAHLASHPSDWRYVLSPILFPSSSSLALSPLLADFLPSVSSPSLESIAFIPVVVKSVRRC